MSVKFSKYLLLGIIILTCKGIYSQDNDSLVQEDGTWDSKYHLYSGKLIGKISVLVQDISEHLLGDEEKYDTSWLYKAANIFHIRTKEWVVREWLLFKEGDIFEPEIVTESERLLRFAGPFLDARIMVKGRQNDTIQVYAEVKDRWTLTPNVSYSNVAESYFGIRDDNFIGWGHSLDLSFTYNKEKYIGTGLKGIYSANNISGSYIKGSLLMESNQKINTQAVNFTRPFLSTELDWAGGIGFIRKSDKLIIAENNTISLHSYKIRGYDIWLGRSFPVWFGGKVFRNRTRLVISGSISRTEHTERPEEPTFAGNLFTNSTIYLVGGGLINRRYYKDYYIDRVGSTEDVPVGGLLSFTAGSEQREGNTRYYSSVKGVLSRRFEDFGYASLLFEFGGFQTKGRFEQTAYNFNFLYHAPLITSGEWKHRLFLRGDYLLGFKRFFGEQIYLNDKNGIRGMQGITVYGLKRAVLNAENRIFSPYSLLGFFFGAKLFIDLGLISGEKESLIQSRLYQGYGFGLRISNESFARAQFEIGVVYNPYLPNETGGSFSLVLTGSFLMGIRDFSFERPYIMSFKNN